MKEKPLLFGYQMARLGTTVEELEVGRKALAIYAEREGYALGDVFVEHDMNRPCSALVALIDAVKQAKVAAIVVPAPTDLGLLPRVQMLTRRRLEREAHVPVLVLRGPRR